MRPRTTIASLLLFIGISSGMMTNDTALKMFIQFQKDFEREYQSDTERRIRFKVFKDNIKTIEAHNSKAGVTYHLGISRFADLTADEFKLRHLDGFVKMQRNSLSVAPLSTRADELPDKVDWRDKGVISPPKDQGSCGSCWAHAAVEQVESYMALSSGKQTPLSVQEMVSCVPNVLECGGTGGCSGSTAELAFSYIQTHGIVTEESMPYEAVNGNCTSGNMAKAAYVRGYEMLPRNDQDAVMNHLATTGPLAVNVDASRFHLYKEGVFSDCDYNKNININHVVQLVGYGTDEKLGDYWLIRNSWGPIYGEEGYIRIKREPKAVCGRDNTPLMGVGCKNDGVDVEHVCGMCGVLYDASYPIGVETYINV